MQTVIPQLRVTDARASLSFYVDGLGFSVDWEHQFEPGFPLFLQLTREARIETETACASPASLNRSLSMARAGHVD